MGLVVAAAGLHSTGLIVLVHGFSCSMVWGIFLAQGRTYVSCVGRWALHCWATREALIVVLRCISLIANDAASSPLRAGCFSSSQVFTPPYLWISHCEGRCQQPSLIWVRPSLDTVFWSCSFKNELCWWLLLDHFSSDLIHGLPTAASCCLLPFPHGCLKGISDLTCCKQSSCWFFFSFSLTQIHFFPDFSAWVNGTATTLHLAHQLNPSEYIQLLTTSTAWDIIVVPLRCPASLTQQPE